MNIRINDALRFALTTGAAMAMAEALEHKALSLKIKAMAMRKHSEPIAEDIEFQALQLLEVANTVKAQL